MHLLTLHWWISIFTNRRSSAQTTWCRWLIYSNIKIGYTWIWVRYLWTGNILYSLLRLFEHGRRRLSHIWSIWTIYLSIVTRYRLILSLYLLQITVYWCNLVIWREHGCPRHALMPLLCWLFWRSSAWNIFDQVPYHFVRRSHVVSRLREKASTS